MTEEAAGGTKTLFDTTRIGPITLKNRLIRSATWEGMADEAGHLTDRVRTVYQDLARGGVGLIITSATRMTPDATGLPGMLSIPNDSFIPEYQDLTDRVHAEGCPIVMQLSFTGRDGAMWTPDVPSAAEIHRIVRTFGECAVRAQKAGFDGVQFHAGHGFFLSQFLNRKKNTRTDDYAGSPENRARIILEIYDEIRRRVGKEFGVLVKINCSDFQEDDEVFAACRYACIHLADRGIDAIEITGGAGGAVPGLEETGFEESVFRIYAKAIAGETPVPVILVGMNRTPAVMDHLLNTTAIRYFSLSRPLLRKPDLVNHWKSAPGEASACISCNQCRQPGGNVCPFA
jgi:2,4-dienoyl-CoA reductase-like NADH-dependent reductase (Old Yellow Enzyme family)